MSIQTLVHGFAKHIRELKAPEYKESQVRLHYIDKFWAALGWDVDNSEQRAPQDVEVLIEPSMDAAEDDGMRSREPDYPFRINGFPRFVVEAKKPSVEIDTEKKAIFQTKRYAWNATIPFSILDDKLLPATSNAVERGNRRHRKMQKTIYRLRTKQNTAGRMAMDRQRDQQATGRRFTTACLHQARNEPRTCYFGAAVSKMFAFGQFGERCYAIALRLRQQILASGAA